MNRHPQAPVVSAASLSAVYVPHYWEGPIPQPHPAAVRFSVADLADPIVELLPPGTGAVAMRVRPEDQVVLAIDSALLGRRPAQMEARECCDPYLYREANTIRCGFRVGRPPPPAYLDSIAHSIARHLKDHYPVVKRGLSARRLERALAFIDAHLAEGIGVAQIAAAAHLSEFHFSRMFRRSMGLAPHAYITQCRLELARELLSGTDLLLADIAGRTGYQTQAHFTHAFREAFGKTPLRYRNDSRGAVAG